jgi:arginase
VTPLPQLVGIPYDASSSFLRGAASGPPLIRAALRSPAGNNFSENGADLSQLADAGDLRISEAPASARAEIESGIARVLNSGFRPIALGGDHSITYPILRSVVTSWRAVTILHIDAHGDLYEEFEGDRYSHACPFARIMEEDLCGQLVQVGVRTLTPHQREQISRYQVECIDMGAFAAGKRPKKIRWPVYVSIDLDGLDPGFAPGVSHREPGGLSVRDVISLIHGLEGPIVGADIVEFNPSQDSSGLTAAVAAKIVKEIAGTILLEGQKYDIHR